MESDLADLEAQLGLAVEAEDYKDMCCVGAVIFLATVGKPTFFRTESQ